ncbi:hypothetical protein Tco_0940507 [Tanacetum coccineum]|uniref:Uncharacterized protein n=1 Tax=Tanacetum coccineum TaxID=301880 RepID=A0ABQ5DNY5_9ASTR
MEGYGTNEVNFTPTQIFSVHMWNIKERTNLKGPPFTAHMMDICNAKEPVAFKAPKTSSHIKKVVPKGENPGDKSGHRKQLPVSKNHPRKKSGTAKDTNPSQPSISTPMVTGMHKEDKQATSGPASLEVTGEGGSNPQLSSSAKGTQNYSIDHIIACAYPNVLVDKTQYAGDRLGTVHTEIGTEKEANSTPEFNTSPEFTRSNDTTKEIKLKDLSKLIKDVGIDLMDLDLTQDDQSFIVQSDEEEEEVHAEPNAETKDTSLEKAQAAAKAKAALFKAQPSFLNFKQLIELLVQSLKHELLKLLTYRDFSASLPKELKELPSNFNEISREIRDLKQYVEGLEIEILGDLKEIHAKLDEFQSSVSGLTNHVVKLNNIMLELPARLLALQEKVSSIQFATAIASALHTTGEQSVPSAGPASAPPAEGENNITQTTPQTKGEQVTKSKEDKGKITLSHEEATEQESKSDSNAEIRLIGSMVESSKRKRLKKFAFVNEQGREELVDLLRFEVVENVYKAKIKYDNYCIKMLNIRKQGRITNYDYKSSVQFIDHEAGTVLNEPSLGMIFFNSHQRQDFISIEDFDVLNNEMLYNVQEIFLRIHKGPGLDDSTRTFSSLLLAEVDKRNLNPLKQMRVIEQLRQ